MLESITLPPPPVARLPIAFGPVLSRRLGWSLGVNDLRPKTCSYACVYCQAGPTTRARVQPEHHYDPDDVVAAVLARVEDHLESGGRLDVVTFVPDGEPTLDAGLGETIELLHAAGLRVAVISNGSLLHRSDVWAALRLADIVSLKVDTVDRATWKRLNRPVGSLDLGRILRSMRAFARGYRGRLLTETMLVAGVNDDVSGLERVAEFLSTIQPQHAYVTLPTRPGTEPGVRSPSGAVALRAAEVLAARRLPTTLLSGGDVADTFAPAADGIEGLLGILAVHPMSEPLARTYMERSAGDWEAVERLVESGRIARIARGGSAFLRVDHAHPSGTRSPGRDTGASREGVEP